MSELNPQIRQASIGIKTLRSIDILPLSIPDQKKLSKIITKGIQTFSSSADKLNDVEVIKTIFNLVVDNLETVLALVIENEKPDELLKEMTNNQAIKIAEIIYEENYEELKKKVQKILGTLAPALSPSIKSQQPSSDVIPNIDSKISSEDLGETEG